MTASTGGRSPTGRGTGFRFQPVRVRLPSAPQHLTSADTGRVCALRPWAWRWTCSLDDGTGLADQLMASPVLGWARELCAANSGSAMTCRWAGTPGRRRWQCTRNGLRVAVSGEVVDQYVGLLAESSGAACLEQVEELAARCILTGSLLVLVTRCSAPEIVLWVRRTAIGRVF